MPTLYRRGFKAIRNKVRRRKSGSKGKRRARTERKPYGNRVVKQLPWTELSVPGLEDLTGLKAAKHPARGKAFRRAMAPWTYRQRSARAMCALGPVSPWGM